MTTVSAPRGRRPAIGLVLAAVLVLSGFGYLIYGGIGDNLVYFMTPDELLERGAAAHDAPIRLGGLVVPGTVVWDAEAIDLRFEVTAEENGVEQIVVHSKKAPPQMFREGMGVVLEGRLRPNGVFEASNPMVKHSNEYRAPEDGKRPEEMYRSLVPGSET
jgi:cytochrome c-type biogenesis protein CcmE